MYSKGEPRPPRFSEPQTKGNSHTHWERGTRTASERLETGVWMFYTFLTKNNIGWQKHQDIITL